ncbi:MAG: lipopolysaccharide heptosyltransferase II [Gammaproteobacteria bacterium]|nr:lipopolysaccharide heptosyltransferase II [Gammaproteobacteria bacterium]
MAAASRILIVGPAWVGDMVMAQSLFISLRQRHPDALIDVLAPAWSVPLLSRMPEVHEAITVPTGHGEFGLAARWRLGRSLRSHHYDQALVLPRSLKSALIPLFAGARVRSGYCGEMRYGMLNDIRALDKRVLTQTVQRFVALGQPADAPLPPATPHPALKVDAGNQRRLLQELGLDLERPVIGFMPGAEYGPAKQWPLAHYAALAGLLVEQGFQVWLFGSAKDRKAAPQIATGLGQVYNLCGRTELVDAVDLIALCRTVVSNDSGLMHVAAAVGTPLVALYGSSTPAYTPPLTDKAEVLYLGLECSPCFKRECPLGHTQCLTRIDAAQALAAVERLLSSENIKQREHA